MLDTIVPFLFGGLGLLCIFWLIKRALDYRRSLELVFLKIRISRKDSDADDKKETIHGYKEQIGLMEQLFAALKSLSSRKLIHRIFGQTAVSFECVARYQEIFFYVSVPYRARNLMEKLIASYYPDSVVELVEEMDVFSGRPVVRAESLQLKKSFFIPLRTYQKLESDPLNNIATALGRLSKDENTIIQVVVRPCDDDWQDKAHRLEKRLRGGKKLFDISWNPLHWVAAVFNFFATEPEEKKSEDENDPKNDAEYIKEKSKKTAFTTSIRVICTGSDEFAVDAQMQHTLAAFSQLTGPGYNSLVPRRYVPTGTILHNYLYRYISNVAEQSMTLNIEELASLFHFPASKYNKTPEIVWQNFKVVKAPANIPHEGLLMGHNEFAGVKTEIRIKNEDRFRHFYVIGQTGTGKSSIMQIMARQDLREGRGLAVIDPHGDLANDLLPFVPRERADDVIYFNPADIERPMGLNLLEANNDDEKEIVAQDALNIMIKLFGNEIFGPRLQDYFRNGVLTLMDYPGGSALTDIVRLFTDDAFQQERRKNLKNPVVKTWWDYTFAKMGEREKGEIIPFWSAKFGGFITNTLMRNIIGQTKSSFDVYKLMQEGKILFVNLSKGKLGDFNANLIGMILVSKIQMGAMKRQDLPKEQRTDFFLYIDEFQNLVTDSIESILSEARKYRLGLIVAHQYLGQLEKSDALTKSHVNLKNAIFGNVGSMMIYKVGPEDAEFIQKQVSPQFSDHDLMNVDKLKGVMKLSIDGQPSTAFSMNPLLPWNEKGDPKIGSAIKELSRLKYGRSRDFIQKEITFRV
ncbi:MAG TPA: type IV secretion system DNA-binding domain-containing protein [bacterium]|nr:type IV secretion system DNA-binding domain-containing protein [bacterium]